MARKIKRKISEKNAHRWAVITVTVVVACMAFVLNNQVRMLKQKQAGYQERIESLTKQVESESKRSEQLEQYRIYVQTKEYVEKVAKEKLGLVKQDEILLKPEQ